MTKPIWVHDTHLACVHSKKPITETPACYLADGFLGAGPWYKFTAHTGIRKRDVKDGPRKVRLKVEFLK